MLLTVAGLIWCLQRRFSVETVSLLSHNPFNPSDDAFLHVIIRQYIDMFFRWGDRSGDEHHEGAVCSIHSHLHGPAALQGESLCLFSSVLLQTVCWCGVSVALRRFVWFSQPSVLVFPCRRQRLCPWRQVWVEDALCCSTGEDTSRERERGRSGAGRRRRLRSTNQWSLRWNDSVTSSFWVFVQM